MWRTINQCAHIYRIITNKAFNDNSDAYVYPKTILNNKQGVKWKKLTITGPGTKVDPSVNIFDEFYQSPNFTLDTPKPIRLVHIFIVNSVI